MPRTPTLAQRFLANPWLWRIWLGAWSVAGPASLVSHLGAGVWSKGDWPWLLLELALVGLICFLFGAIAGAFVLGPILFERGLKNGGPFAVGDTVQVLSGPHAGKVTQVYAFAQHETPRVRLDAEAEKSFKDIFPDFQLLRETPATEPAQRTTEPR